jgi:gas vesicle protein
MGRNNTRSEKSSVTPFLFGMLAGGAVGAALALLFAPKEGAEIRSDLSQKFDEITDSVNSILDGARESADKLLNEGRERGERIVDQAKEKASNLMNDADRFMGAAKQRGNGQSGSDAGSQA